MKSRNDILNVFRGGRFRYRIYLMLHVKNYWGRFIHNIPEMISFEVEKQNKGEF